LDKGLYPVRTVPVFAALRVPALWVAADAVASLPAPHLTFWFYPGSASNHSDGALQIAFPGFIHLLHCINGKQKPIVLAPGLYPSIILYATTTNNTMQMRVKTQVLPPGMQHI